MLQIFEKIKPLDSAPISLSVTTAALSSTRAGRLCGLYTLHLYFYVFAEAVAVAIIDCYPTTAPSVLLLSKQALQHCFNSKARQVSPELLLRICIFEDCFRFLMDMPQAARLFDDEERAVPVAASSHAVRQQWYKQRAMKKQELMAEQPS
jgi:hypothetical protein